MLHGDLRIYAVVDGRGQARRLMMRKNQEDIFRSLGIVWIYNLIWFIPLDYIKFALQAAFSGNLHVVKPFEHMRRRIRALKQTEATVVPMDQSEDRISNRSPPSKQASRPGEFSGSQRGQRAPTKFDGFTQRGASFYAPYTEPLSALSVLPMRTPLIKSTSI